MERVSIMAMSADMLFGSRIRGAARATGAEVALIGRPDELQRRAAEQPPTRIILDLDHRRVDMPQLIRALKADPVTSGIPVVAYVSHVNADAIAAARAAGADRVMARSAFVNELPALMR